MEKTPREERHQRESVTRSYEQEEDLYRVRNYKRPRQISVYLCLIYGIVIAEIYSHNKELYTYKVAYLSFLYCLSMQRLDNPKTSIVYHGAPLHM